MFLGLAAIVTAILFVCKVIGIGTFSWFWIFAPLFIWLIAWVIVFVIIFMGMIIGALLSKM